MVQCFCVCQDIPIVKHHHIEHIWAKLKDARYFSSLDIRSGYHHISVHPDSRRKTAFICPYGEFQWKRVSYIPVEKS